MGVVSHRFFLPLPPHATQRSRCTCRGRYPTVYTEGKYKEWRSKAVSALKELAAKDEFQEVRDRPVTIDVEVIAERPKATKLFAPRWDNDNVEKGLWDAITSSGLWWKDDKQIVENRTVKRWAEPGEEPGYAVTIAFLDEGSFSKN